MTNLESATYDLLGMIEDHTVNATWSGVEYPGTSGGLVTTKRLESGGFLEDYDLQWVTSLWKRTAPGVNELVERFPNQNAVVPAEGDTLTIDGVEYRIERVTRDDFLAGLQLDLVTANK